MHCKLNEKRKYLWQHPPKSPTGKCNVVVAITDARIDSHQVKAMQCNAMQCRCKDWYIWTLTQSNGMQRIAMQFNAIQCRCKYLWSQSILKHCLDEGAVSTYWFVNQLNQVNQVNQVHQVRNFHQIVHRCMGCMCFNPMLEMPLSWFQVQSCCIESRERFMHVWNWAFFILTMLK